jgi:exosome complex component RRP4
MTRLKESNEIVTPGEAVFEGTDIDAASGVYQKGEKIYSKYLGSVQYKNNHIEVRPLSGRYVPQEGDIVIGEVSRVSYSRWNVDFNSPYEGTLNIADATDEYVDLDEDDLTDFFDVGDAVMIEITSVSESKDVDMSMEDRRCKKLEGGRIIEISPSKVPRVIGKQGTMVKQIIEYTGANILVGQNGLVWINGGDMNLAAKAVKKVEEEAHTDGLTDRIAEWLEEKTEDNEEGEEQ